MGIRTPPRRAGSRRPWDHEGRMLLVTRIDAPMPCLSCRAIRFLFLSNGRKVRPEEAYRMLIAGAALRCGSEKGPFLQIAVWENDRYVRVRGRDDPDDELLRLPRCQ